MTNEEKKMLLSLQLENLALKHAMVTRDLAELDAVIAEEAKPVLKPVMNSD